MLFDEIASLSNQKLFAEVQSLATGLSTEQAVARQKLDGLNALETNDVSAWQLFFHQLRSPFVYLLAAAAFLSIALGNYTEGAMVAVFILINTFLGFFQEYQSHKALALLKSFIKPICRVRRDGVSVSLSCAELVPGDVIVLEAGDLVPADARLLEATNALVDESVLTGESVPVQKVVEPVAKVKAIHEAKNLVFSGTRFVEGRVEAMVYATGNKTQLGRIAALSTGAQHLSAFEQGIANFSHFILKLIGITLVLVFLANLLLKGDQAQPLELLLFSIALAVSVVPEALPLVTTISLSRGAVRMARKQVVVKRLSSIEDLGGIEILCTDKTGTITQNHLEIADRFSCHEDECLLYGALGAGQTEARAKETNNSFDLAFFRGLSPALETEVAKVQIKAQLPFDPGRRRNSVVIEREGALELIVRGAPETLVACCLDIGEMQKTELLEWSSAQGAMGRRVMAIACKRLHELPENLEKAESYLQLIGAVSFTDPLKPSSVHAIAAAKQAGIAVKILTGDSPEVAFRVAKDVKLASSMKDVMTGDAFEALSPALQASVAESITVFARMSPEQKYRVIQILQQKRQVGFLGEGINDAPALKIAHVGLAVQGASEIARDTADVILLNKSLDVIVEGIREGRHVFANTVKYIRATLTSNFGNFYAIAISSLFIPFLPILPVQILLINLLTDFPMIAISMDSVDACDTDRPRKHDVKELILLASVLGVISTLFDFLFFAMYYRTTPATLQTNWFVGSILTELVLIFSIRTKLPFWKAKAPSRLLIGLSVGAAILTVALPYTAFGNTFFSFMAPTASQLMLTLGLVAAYFVSTETVKYLYYRLSSKKPKTTLS